jgi:hypothetical protein
VSEPLLAALEIGGTKTLVAIGTGPEATLQLERLPTESREATLATRPLPPYVHFLHRCFDQLLRLATGVLDTLNPVPLP